MGRTIDDVFNCLAAFIETQIERDMGNEKTTQAVESEKIDAKVIKFTSEGVNQLTSEQKKIESVEATIHQVKNAHRIKRNRAAEVVTSENIPAKSVIESFIIPSRSCSQTRSYLAAYLDTGQLSSNFNYFVYEIF